MTDEQFKLLIELMNTQTRQTLKQLACARGEISVLSQFIIEASRLPEMEKQAMHQKLKLMREDMNQKISGIGDPPEFPPGQDDQPRH